MYSFIINNDPIYDLMAHYYTNYNQIKNNEIDNTIITNGIIRVLCEMYFNKHLLFDNYSIYKYIFDCKKIIDKSQIQYIFIWHNYSNKNLIKICQILEVENKLRFLPNKNEKEYIDLILGTHTKTISKTQFFDKKSSSHCAIK